MKQTKKIEIRCHWGYNRSFCKRKPILEMESLLGNWSPICKYHLGIRQRNNNNNPWGALFEIKTRELKTVNLLSEAKK